MKKTLFDLLADLAPGQFRQLLKVSRQDSATSPTAITRENKQLDDLYFILDGNLSIEKGGQRAPSESRTFIGEIAFLLSRPATATVILEPGSVYFVWNANALHRLLRAKPALNNALSAVMNKKLAQKVANAGVLMNTIGLDYRAP